MASRFALLALEGDSDDERATKPAQAAKPAAAVNGADKAGRKPREQGSRAPAARKVFQEETAGVAPPADDGRDDRAAANRGRGSGRGARGGRGAGRGGRLDRHSATGIHDSDKKEHQGWGGDEGKRELEAENEGKADAKAEASGWDTGAADGETAEGDASAANGDAAAPSASKKKVVEAAPEPEPEVDNSKTYDEYMAERKAAAKAELPSLAGTRQANEGVDDAQWKNGVAFSKKEQTEEDPIYAGKGESKARQRKAKEGKTFLDVELSYGPPGGSGGERGGRGRGRGGRGDGFRGRGRGEGFRGRGGPRGAPRGGASAGFNATDASAFPSLA